MLPWFAALNLDAYLYAPKNDAWLRRQWRDRWPRAYVGTLQELAAAAASAGVEFHVGLSPFALYQSYGVSARDALRGAVRRLEDLGVSGVAILFDDMPGGVDSLAERQAEILVDVHHWLDKPLLRFCPTYYSDDPVLDRVFGDRPENYLVDLARCLPDGLIPFWTGPAVCAETVPAAHLEELRDAIGRPLALWDNYPVNDSRSRSEHLYLAPLRARTVTGALESHWCNAMNQAALSLPALSSLARLHGREPVDLSGVFAEAGVTEALVRACLPLADRGRETLDDQEKASLLSRAVPGSAAAEELRDWIQGLYRFDPACLTD
jgi:hyaluronoglucosaminidase